MRIAVSILKRQKNMPNAPNVTTSNEAARLPANFQKLNLHVSFQVGSCKASPSVPTFVCQFYPLPLQNVTGCFLHNAASIGMDIDWGRAGVRKHWLQKSLSRVGLEKGDGLLQHWDGEVGEDWSGEKRDLIGAGKCWSEVVGTGFSGSICKEKS